MVAFDFNRLIRCDIVVDEFSSSNWRHIIINSQHSAAVTFYRL